MAKKEKKINYKEMDVEDLDHELGKNQEDLFKLKFRAVSAPIDNVMKIQAVRREIARIQTFLNQKRRQNG